MSLYFNGDQFRAIDSAAAADNEPMSAALEAQLANNQHYLHRVGGGAVVKLGTPSGAEWDDDNEVADWSYGLSSLHYQPFLVTRGLTEIRLDWQGRIEDWDIDVRMELLGFGVVEGTWAEAGPANVHRTLILQLPAPAEYEFETDLVLWQIGKIGVVDGDPQAGVIIEGRVEAAPGDIGADTLARTVVTLNPGDDDGAVVTPLEALVTTSGNLSDGTIGDLVFTTSNASGAGLRFAAARVSRVATRSIQITQRHA